MTKGSSKIKIDDNEVTAELESEIEELKKELTLKEYVHKILERVIRIEQKVDIHNNYEPRITALEKFMWKAIGFGIPLGFVISVVSGVVTALVINLFK